MDRLPSEILSDIFLATLPRNHERDPSPHSIQAPLSVSHVCRFWRDVSLSCGELWSYLQIRLDSKGRRDESKRKRLLEVFDTWLSRTNGSPINYMVQYRLWFGGDREMDQDFEYIISTLISQQRRWKNMSFTLYGIRVSSDFPGLVLTNMPMLTSLSLSFSLKSDKRLRATISISRSSRLKSLHLDGNYDLETGNVPILSLTGPSSLRADSPCSDALRHCLNFLGIAPNLIDFRFTYEATGTPSLPYLDTRQPILLPRLRVLATTGHCSSLVIDNLTLPSLEILLTNGIENGSESEVRLNFFRRSLPPLTRLDVGCENVDVYIPCLCLLPKLERLRIRYSTISERFFHELALPDDIHVDSRIVCPSLMFIELYILEIQNDVEACVNTLFSMAKSRAETLRTFKTAELSLERNPREPPPTIITNLVGDDASWSIDNLRRALLWGRVIIRDDERPRPIG